MSGEGTLVSWKGTLHSISEQMHDHQNARKNGVGDLDVVQWLQSEQPKAEKNNHQPPMFVYWSVSQSPWA